MTARAAGYAEETIGRLRAAQEIAGPDGLDDLAVALLAEAYTSQGDLKQALGLYDQLLARDDPAAHPDKRAHLLAERAGVLSLLGRDRRALADLTEAEAILDADDGVEAALILGPAYENLGRLQENLGRLAAAATAYERTLRSRGEPGTGSARRRCSWPWARCSAR